MAVLVELVVPGATEDKMWAIEELTRRGWAIPPEVR